MKTVEIEYIESGAFQGGEEDVSTAGIKYGEMCIVMSKKTFSGIKVADMELRAELNRLNAVNKNLARRIHAMTRQRP